MSALRGANIREEAAHWLLREEEGRLGPDDRGQLEDWLSADPRHRSAFEAARVVCETTARHAAHPEVLALRGVALAAGPERRPIWRVAASLVAGVLVLGAAATTLTAIRAPAASRIGAVAATFAPGLPREAALYRTAVGQRSTVVLPDGSVATLNTGSILKVAYTGKERGVRLLRGQALFDVAKNKERPFQVYAGDRRITAVGTVFDVRLDGERVKVALVEGVVRVAPLAARAAPQVTMKAGEVLAVQPQAPARLAAADIRRETSWREGVVVFDDAPLSQAVAEINRYTPRPLTLAEPQIGEFRVSGVFKTGDPERFATAMTEVFPLVAAHARDGSQELRWAPQE